MVRKPAQASNVPRPAPPQKARPVTAPSPQPSRTSQRWKVVAPGDDHDGQNGTADPVHDYDDEFVYLKFSGDAETYAFRHAEVVPVAHSDELVVAQPTPNPEPVQQEAGHGTQQQAGWNPQPDAKDRQPCFDGTSRADHRAVDNKPPPWASIPTGGRIVLAAVALAVVGGTIAVLASSASRDSESYRYGQEQVSPVAVTLLESGIEGTDYACQEAVEMVMWTDDDLVYEDVVAGCLDGLGD